MKIYFLMQIVEAAREKLKKSIVHRTISFNDFINGIHRGSYSDDKGYANIVLNESLNVSYNVYIDRMCVTKVGSILSFDFLKKTYGAETIQFLYSPKQQLISV